MKLQLFGMEVRTLMYTCLLLTLKSAAKIFLPQISPPKNVYIQKRASIAIPILKKAFAPPQALIHLNTSQWQWC